MGHLYLEGHGDLVSKVVMGISTLLYRLQGLLSYLLSPPGPPSSEQYNIWVYKGSACFFKLPCGCGVVLAYGPWTIGGEGFGVQGLNS